MGPDAGLNLQHLDYSGGKQSFCLNTYLQQQEQQHQQEQPQHDMVWTQHQDHWPQPPSPKRYFQQGMDSLLYSRYSGMTAYHTKQAVATERSRRTLKWLF
jgi:hypothetical protein